jgi:hypothetical protein
MLVGPGRHGNKPAAARVSCTTRDLNSRLRAAHLQARREPPPTSSETSTPATPPVKNLIRLTGASVALSLAALAAPLAICAQGANASLPLKHKAEPTGTGITAADLISRLYLYADDSMQGRESGTEGNLKAVLYIAGEAKRLGLLPAGDSGTFFQSLPMVKRQFDPKSELHVDGGKATLAMGTDFLPIARGPVRDFSGTESIFGGTWGDTASYITSEQAAGKIVVLAVQTDAVMSGRLRRPTFPAGSRLGTAAAVALPFLELLPPQFRPNPAAPSIVMNTAPAGSAPAPLILYVSRAGAATLMGAPLDSLKPGAAGKPVHSTISHTESPAPARNVVAILPGSDPKLKGEYVAIGAHNDHIGIRGAGPLDHDSLRAAHAMRARLEASAAGGRPTAEQLAAIKVNVDSLRAIRPARPDSINNGADDDGSGTVSVLEIAEAFAGARARPRRSVLFVWHTGEEKGLLGSQWFTDHPTVPRDSIVAQLNMDMVGRGTTADVPNGGLGYLQLIGSRRLSTELGDLVEAVNKTEKHPFTFDYAYDANGHPENYYCRSDHYMYARYGIPIVFFSTGDHIDYHQVTDEPQYIDYPHMAAVGQLVFDIANAVANLDHRPVVDKPKPDPNGTCRQ